MAVKVIYTRQTAILLVHIKIMTEKTETKENLLLNFLLNIIIPTLILIKFSGEDTLGVKNGIIVALSFPIGYGLYDFFRTRKFNIFSGIGIISILLTGGISLLELDPKYIAIKEAAIPAIIGFVTLASLYTKYPLLKTVFFNEKFVQVERIKSALKDSNAEQAFDTSFRNASLLFSSSFFLSSLLNYALARYLIVSSPGTEEFNAELGRMTALSYPVITIPSLIVMFTSLIYLYRRITKLTHLKFEEIIIDPEGQK